MHFFNYKPRGGRAGRGGRGGLSLFAEDVPIEKIVKEVGTPVYIYSQRTLKRHFHAFDAAFKNVESIVCYSVKANSNLAVLKIFVGEGSGFDIVSGGELYRVLKAGADPGRVVFSGVGKTIEEMEFALNKNILMFNVESPQELDTLDRVARRLKKKARFSIRINPDVDAKTHPYVSTGLKKNKFGIAGSLAVKEYARARREL